LVFGFGFPMVQPVFMKFGNGILQQEDASSFRRPMEFLLEHGRQMVEIIATFNGSKKSWNVKREKA
jgi:hypothetical protein